MLTELTKRVSRQQLYLYGHFSHEELKQLRKDGWWIVWSEKAKVEQKPRKILQQKRNGVAVEIVI